MCIAVYFFLDFIYKTFSFKSMILQNQKITYHNVASWMRKLTLKRTINDYRIKILSSSSFKGSLTAAFINNLLIKISNIYKEKKCKREMNSLWLTCHWMKEDEDEWMKRCTTSVRALKINFDVANLFLAQLLIQVISSKSNGKCQTNGRNLLIKAVTSTVRIIIL